MSDKSPRQSASKKPGRSIKEKRLVKKSRRATAENDRMTVFLRGEPKPPARKA
jgi:chaperone required for assembly of F1-ATPase